MKIAVLAHSFPRFPADTHGTFVKSLCEALAQLGHEVHVLIPFDVELRPDPDSPLKIHHFRYIWPDSWHQLGYSRTLRRDVAMRPLAWLQSPLYFLFAERALKRLVQRENIDLVHAHWHLPNGWVAQRVKKSTGVPFAVTLHGSDIFMAERNKALSAMARQALAAAAHVTSCSGDLRDRLLRIGGAVHGHKVHLVANGTDLLNSSKESLTKTDAPGLRERLGLTEHKRVVAAVGRMVDKKGFRYLIEAIPDVLKLYPEVRFVIGGGGDLLEAHQNQCRALGIEDRVIFPGVLNHDEVLELLDLCEVFTMPSVRDDSGNIDGLPIVVLEAMAAGRPVVATNLAGMPLAVEEGKTGLMVSEKDPRALTSALVELLANPEQTSAMGEAGRRKVELELNWNAVARRHDELYREAIL